MAPDRQFPTTGQRARVDAVVVGAGLAGLYMLHRLRDLGLSARVFEAGDDVGGTWYWNRYPGARCDVESLDYSYGFSEALQQAWSWSERYAAQPEILRYVAHVADRFDLRRDIQPGTRVTAAHFNEAESRWDVVTDRGDRVSARFLIMATGCLSKPQMPSLPGLDRFAGACFLTSRWPHHEVSFTGQRVGVVGTGSSAIQTIPVVAEQAASLVVFQRTPGYSVPAHNAPLDPAVERAVKAEYPAYRQRLRESRVGYIVPANDCSALAVSAEERQRQYELRWQRGGLGFGQAFNDLITSKAANDTAADFFRGKIRAIVADPATAEALTSADYPLGAKRICVDSGYYQTFNRDHVRLVDLRREPLVAATRTGVRTTARDYPLDSLVFAIGFDALTGALLDIDIRGRGGRELRHAWVDRPRSYLGLAVSGFPNLFTITGPGSPSVLSNMIVSIEQHVDWIAGLLAHLGERGKRVVEATAEAEAAWGRRVDEAADATLFPLARSWYTGANIPGKPRIFMPFASGVGTYRQICDEIAATGYEGFALRG
jgi:cyclohexanone monooxygenase